MATDAREHAGDGLPLVLEPGRKQQSDTIVEITKALVKFQMKVPPIPRNRTVTVRSPKGDYEFAYATLDVIMSAIRVPLAECGLVIVQTLTTDQPPILITKVLHESGDFIGSELVVSSGSSSGPQAMGSVISYMRRYAVAAVLALTTEDDDDANSAEGNSVQERKPGPRAATTASTTAPTQPTTKPSTDKQLGLVRNLVCEKLKVERGTDDATKENALRVANIFKPEHTIMALTFQQASALIDRLNKIGAAPAAAATATPAAKLEGDHSPEHLLHQRSTRHDAQRLRAAREIRRRDVLRLRDSGTRGAQPGPERSRPAGRAQPRAAGHPRHVPAARRAGPHSEGPASRCTSGSGTLMKKPLVNVNPIEEQEPGHEQLVMPGVPPPPKINLFIGEHRLKAAWEALEREDAEGNMTAEEQEAVLRSYVNREATVENRDAFVRFIRSVEATAEAKEAEAKAYAEPLMKEAARMRAGVERWKAQVVRLMNDLGVDELFGKVYTLLVKRSRGRAVVFDETAVPDQFRRVKNDDDLLLIRELMQMLEQAVIDVAQLRAGAGELGPAARKRVLDGDGGVHRARAMVVLAEQRRKTIDKTEIQKAWKQNGGDDMRAANEEDRVTAAALGLPAKEYVLVVPGVSKEVDETLEIK
jgi:hypothetical protein